MKSRLTRYYHRYVLTFVVLFTVSACSLFNRKHHPFAISEEETYWTFDMVFDEKSMEVRVPVFPEDSLKDPRQRESLESKPYSGKAYLTQNGSAVQGFAAIGGDTILLRGDVTEDNDGKRWLGLDFEGNYKQQAAHGITTVALEGSEGTGDFINVGTASGKMVYGGMRFNGIMRQDAPPGPVKQERVGSCGKKLRELIHIFRSPATGRVIRVKIEKYETCMKATFLDESDKPLQGKIVMDRDLVEVPGPTDTVRVYDGVLDKKIINKDADGNGNVVLGEIKYIAVSGQCTDLKYYQYVKETTSMNGRLPEEVRSDWRQDGPQPYPAVPPMPRTTEKDSVVLDIPSYPENELPYQNLPPQSTYAYTHTYVTYVCCDKRLLGAVTWGYTVTYTTIGELRKTVTKIPPRWTPSDQLNGFPSKDAVIAQCAGN